MGHRLKGAGRVNDDVGAMIFERAGNRAPINGQRDEAWGLCTESASPCDGSARDQNLVAGSRQAMRNAAAETAIAPKQQDAAHEIIGLPLKSGETSCRFR
jgi:hypothetical protein